MVPNMINIKKWYSDNISLKSKYAVNFWEFIWVIPLTLATNLLTVLLTEKIPWYETLLLLFAIFLLTGGVCYMYGLNIILKEVRRAQKEANATWDDALVAWHQKPNQKIDVYRRARFVFFIGIILPFSLLITLIVIRGYKQENTKAIELPPVPCSCPSREGIEWSPVPPPPHSTGEIELPCVQHLYPSNDFCIDKNQCLNVD